MTLLPSINVKETRTGVEIPTGRDYLITDVKLLTFARPEFFLRGNVLEKRLMKRLIVSVSLLIHWWLNIAWR